MLVRRAEVREDSNSKAKRGVSNFGPNVKKPTVQSTVLRYARRVMKNEMLRCVRLLRSTPGIEIGV